MLGDELRLFFFGRILESGLRIIEGDFLGVAPDLVVSGFVLVDIEQCSGVVRDEYRQRLCGPARRANRPGVVDVDELRAVVVFEQFHPVDALDGCSDDTFGE